MHSDNLSLKLALVFDLTSSKGTPEKNATTHIDNFLITKAKNLLLSSPHSICKSIGNFFYRCVRVSD